MSARRPPGRGYAAPVRRPISLVVPLVAAALATAAAGCGSNGDDGAVGRRGDRPPSTEQLATGLGFTVRVPPGWTDVAEQLNTGGLRYDVAAGDTTATGFKNTVTVKRDGGSRLRGTTLEGFDAASRRLAAQDPGVTVRTGAPVTLDGEPARSTVTFRTQGGRRLAGHQVIALHGGELYSVLLTSTAGDARAEGTLRTMLATWRWTR